MSHSRISTTTNILNNTLLNTNHSKHHQIQLQALSIIMLLLIIFPINMYIILVIYEDNYFEAETFMSGRCYQNMSIAPISHAQVL